MKTLRITWLLLQNTLKSWFLPINYSGTIRHETGSSVVRVMIRGRGPGMNTAPHVPLTQVADILAAIGADFHVIL